jgi:hypothetical protein
MQWGLRSCESAHILKTRRTGTCTSRDFGVKVAPELFDAKFTICVTFPDKPGEGSIQVIGLNIYQQIGYWVFFNTERKHRVCEDADSEGAYN